MTKSEIRISGIEFEVDASNCVTTEGRSFLTPEEAEELGLDQLVEEGWLTVTPVKADCWGNVAGHFYRLADRELWECEGCGVSIPEDDIFWVCTYPGRSPSFSDGGIPPEYEAVCGNCGEPDFDESDR